MRWPRRLLSYARCVVPTTRLAKLRKNEDGATAIEFASISWVFLAFIFGLIGIALYYFIVNSVEKGMDTTSRLIRTGQAKESGMTVNEFKQAICDQAGGWIDCTEMQVFVHRFDNWATVTPQACVDENEVVITNDTPGSAKISESAGAASEIVIVTSCYKWKLTSKIPFLDIGNMSDGSRMVQAATAFRVEPHDKD